MDALSFAFWLNGFFELSDATQLDSKQTQIIRDHLDLVFTKVTPNRKTPEGELLVDVSKQHIGVILPPTDLQDGQNKPSVFASGIFVGSSLFPDKNPDQQYNKINENPFAWHDDYIC